MVFTETARRMVVKQRLAEFDKVRVVPHGAPDELTLAGLVGSNRRRHRKLVAATRPAKPGRPDRALDFRAYFRL